MNWSAAEVPEVPPLVVTVTSTVPAVSAGDVAVIEVVLSAVTDATVVPNRTAVALARFVPVMVTTVPPSVVPVVGASWVSVGTGAL